MDGGRSVLNARADIYQNLDLIVFRREGVARMHISDRARAACWPPRSPGQRISPVCQRDAAVLSFIIPYSALHCSRSLEGCLPAGALGCNVAIRRRLALDDVARRI